MYGPQYFRAGLKDPPIVLESGIGTRVRGAPSKGRRSAGFQKAPVGSLGTAGAMVIGYCCLPDGSWPGEARPGEVELDGVELSELGLAAAGPADP